MTCEPQSIVHHLIRIPQNVTKQVKKCNSSLMAERVKKSSSSGSLTSWMTSSSATSTTGNSNNKTMNDSWNKNRAITTPFRYTRKKVKSFQIDKTGEEDCSIITMEPPVAAPSPTIHKKERSSPRSSPQASIRPPMDSYDKNPENDDDNGDDGDVDSITSHDEGDDDVSINLATFKKSINIQSSQGRLLDDSILQGADDSIKGLGTSFSRAQTFRPQLERVISFRSTQIMSLLDDSEDEKDSILPLEDIDQIGFMTQCMIDTSRPCFVHFFVEGSEASDILDGELGQLHAQCVDNASSSSSASSCRFMRIGANSAPFITSKLKINTLEPSVICFHNGHIFERITDPQIIIQYPGQVRKWALGTGLLEL